MKRSNQLNIIILFLLINIPTVSQTHPNSLYFEALGNGILYSINYDRMINENFGGRIGIMYLPEFGIIFSSIENLVMMPVMLNYFVGEKHKLELGAGIVYSSFDKGDLFKFEAEGKSGVVGTATIGYRYQKPEGGFLWRIGFTPFFSNEVFVPSGGISLGYSF